jgi:hypothetical protein
VIDARGTKAMSWRWAMRAVVAIAPLLSLGSGPGQGPEGPTKPEALGMTPAVVCETIEGYEDYRPLPGASLTSDEKLLVYYRPLGYRVEQEGPSFRLRLTQDGQIRRRGEKAVLQKKAKLLDYEVKAKAPPGPIYLRNMISLKGLKPGEYDFDIILHDEVGAGPPAMQTVPFRVVLPASPPGQ